jgi:hypothetical protein
LAAVVVTAMPLGGTGTATQVLRFRPRITVCQATLLDHMARLLQVTENT